MNATKVEAHTLVSRHFGVYVLLKRTAVRIFSVFASPAAPCPKHTTQRGKRQRATGKRPEQTPVDPHMTIHTSAVMLSHLSPSNPSSTPPPNQSDSKSSESSLPSSNVPAENAARESDTAHAHTQQPKKSRNASVIHPVELQVKCKNTCGPWSRASERRNNALHTPTIGMRAR